MVSQAEPSRTEQAIVDVDRSKRNGAPIEIHGKFDTNRANLHEVVQVLDQHFDVALLHADPTGAVYTVDVEGGDD